MQKKLIAVAVAGVLAAPLALAQSNVTISGTLNAGFENISASGGTLTSVPATQVGSLTSRTRIVDNSSELRFTVTEDLGGGLSAFGTIGAAVDPGNTNVVATTGSGSLGSRNTGVGLRSGKWGEIMFGNWDLQWHTIGGIDGMWVKGAAAGNSSAVLLTQGRAGKQGSQGGRFGNQIRYVSPTWNGFNVTAQYARHVEAVNATGGPNNINDRDTTWAINPTYNNGPWMAMYAYMARNNVALTAATSALHGAAGGGVQDQRGHRAGLAYTFAMGLKIGIIWDSLKIHEQTNVADAGTAVTGSGSAKRTGWAIPVSYTTGAHGFGVTYARVGSLSTSGSNAASAAAFNAADNNTGAHYWNLAYQYSLSKRTNLWVNYSRITNSSGAAYDFAANAGIGMAGANALSGGATRTGNEGADPRTFGVGIRHAF